MSPSLCLSRPHTHTHIHALRLPPSWSCQCGRTSCFDKGHKFPWVSVGLKPWCPECTGSVTVCMRVCLSASLLYAKGPVRTCILVRTQCAKEVWEDEAQSAGQSRRRHDEHGDVLGADLVLDRGIKRRFETDWEYSPMKTCTVQNNMEIMLSEAVEFTQAGVEWSGVVLFCFNLDLCHQASP